MDDRKLIKLVRKYPLLYDLSHMKYMDIAAKNKIWNKIGEEMNLDGAAIKARWNNIRDTYRKTLKINAKNRSIGLKKPKMYKYAYLLGFLNSSLGGESSGSIENADAQLDEDGDSSLLGEADATENCLTHHISDQLPTVKSATKLCKNQTTSDAPTAATKLVDYIIAKTETPSHVESQDPVDAFAACIASTLKTLSPYHLHLAKSEIFNTVQKYELQTMLGDQLSPPNLQYHPTEPN